MSNLDVRLREVQEADIAIFCANERDPVARQMAAFTTAEPLDDDACRARWGRVLANPEGIVRTIVVGGEVAGSVLSYVLDGEREVSYWLGREWWGRGIARAALRQFLDIERTRPLHGRVAHDNPASLRVLLACGFVVCGQDRGFAAARGEEIDEILLLLTGSGEELHNDERTT
jgi:RimJ/RimL family protein N-acetyltransferase